MASSDESSANRPPPRRPAPHDGRRYTNQLTPARDVGIRELLRWRTTRQPGTWERWRPLSGAYEPPETAVRGSDIHVTFINHATVLLQTQGVNMVTDPVWSQRCSPVQWAGPRRHRPPGVAFDALPPIDMVLLSHDHYDHLDLPTLRRLHARDAPLIVTGRGVGEFLAGKGLTRVVELDWWERTEADGLEVTAVPAAHFSGRGLTDRDTRLWIGHVVHTQQGPCYFAGDTGWGPHFAQIFEAFGPCRLALLPIGAYRPEWFMAPVHISPAEAVEAHRVLGSKLSVPIHFGTFNLADDGQDEPVADLRRALTRSGVDALEFATLDHGERRVIRGDTGNA